MIFGEDQHFAVDLGLREHVEDYRGTQGAGSLLSGTGPQLVEISLDAESNPVADMVIPEFTKRKDCGVLEVRKT